MGIHISADVLMQKMPKKTLSSIALYGNKWYFKSIIGGYCQNVYFLIILERREMIIVTARTAYRCEN